MVPMEQIERLGRRIGEQFGAERVILFGSHAQGTAGPDSDVDLLIILPFEGQRARQSAAIRGQLQPGFPMDLLVRTPDEIQQRLALGDPFIREIVAHGQLLYESCNP